METTFTKVGGELLAWERLRPCRLGSRWLWVALYISPRRILPGLHMAGIPTVADTAKMQPDETVDALDDLLDHELVEYDRQREVLRLTEFPDRAERPCNGRHLRSLWTRFRTVTSCQVRDAHVALIHWLLHDPSKPPTDDHLQAWSQTFGTVSVPVHRRRGVRRLLDSDTSTAVQPGLFTNPATPVIPTTETIPYPIPYTDTVWHTHRSQISDLGSVSDLEESTSRAIPSGGGDLHQQRPALGLVPLPPGLPFSIGDALASIASESSDRFPAGPVDDRLADALEATIRACEKQEVGLEDLRLVGRWLGKGALSFRSDLGPVWISRPGNLLDAVAQARAWRARGEPAIGGTPSRSVVPAAPPTPNSAFINGRKML